MIQFQACNYCFVIHVHRLWQKSHLNRRSFSKTAHGGNSLWGIVSILQRIRKTNASGKGYCLLAQIVVQFMVLSLPKEEMRSVESPWTNTLPPQRLRMRLQYTRLTAVVSTSPFFLHTVSIFFSFFALQIENKFKISSSRINTIYRKNKKG